MRPTVLTYGLAIVVPAAGPGTSLGVVGIGICCATAPFTITKQGTMAIRVALSHLAVVFDVMVECPSSRALLSFNRAGRRCSKSPGRPSTPDDAYTAPAHTDRSE